MTADKAQKKAALLKERAFYQQKQKDADRLEDILRSTEDLNRYLTRWTDFVSSAFLEEARRRGDTEFIESILKMQQRVTKLPKDQAEYHKAIQAGRYRLEEEIGYVDYRIRQLEADDEAEGSDSAAEQAERRED